MACIEVKKVGQMPECSVVFVYIKVWLKQPNPQVHGS